MCVLTGHKLLVEFHVRSGFSHGLCFQNLKEVFKILSAGEIIQCIWSRVKKSKSDLFIITIYTTVQKFGVTTIVWCFWKKSLMVTKAAFT